MAEHVIFQRDEVSHGQFGLTVNRPEFTNGVDLPAPFGSQGGDRLWFLVVFAVFALVGIAVIMVRKGTTGRYFAALRGSETAASSVGINATALRIILFAFSAFIAGLGGGLQAIQDGTINPINSYPAIYGVLWVVLVVTLGSRTVDGAANAALGFVVFSWLTQDALSLPAELVIMGFGLGAITYARHPEGVIEYQTRKSILTTIRQRMLKQRADTLKEEGTLPPQYRPTWHVTAPVFAGPALYFLYILLRSPIQGHWVAVHSGTLLAFILPSVVFALFWFIRTDALLRRDGGVPFGHLLLLAGAGIGALAGWRFAAHMGARSTVCWWESRLGSPGLRSSCCPCTFNESRAVESGSRARSRGAKVARRSDSCCSVRSSSTAPPSRTSRRTSGSSTGSTRASRRRAGPCSSSSRSWSSCGCSGSARCRPRATSSPSVARPMSRPKSRCTTQRSASAHRPWLPWVVPHDRRRHAGNPKRR
jgi:hypothetical protein